MTSTNLNKSFPCSAIGPQWPGVKVLVTETGCLGATGKPDGYGFNLGTHVGDALHDVQVRRRLVQEEMGAPVVWLNQVHGCGVFNATAAPIESVPPEADASVSTGSDVALAIMTADCLPVVFAAFDSTGRALGVAAAHAGWRGLYAGVLQATATQLAQACAVPVSQVRAWMGPAIGPDSFEVGQEVVDAFVNQDLENRRHFRPGQGHGKFLADIYGLASAALTRSGLGHVDGGGWDTLTDLRWFSHRRGRQQSVASGRFATLIRLLPVAGA